MQPHDDPTNKPVGFLGLGAIGRPVATRLLQSGRPLVAYDVDAKACEAMRILGAEVAGSIRALADRAEIVFLSLPTPQIVTEVTLGADGLCNGEATRLVVDLSTIGPRVAAEVSAGLAKRGISYVDAPVSGGAAGAAAGTLVVMTAGPEDAVRRVTPLLRLIGNRIVAVGDRAGQAQTAKLVNNALFAANLLGAMEALALGVKSGLEVERLLEILNMSSGRSYVTEGRLDAVIGGDDTARFAAGLLRKDVGLAMDAAQQIEARLPLFRSVAGFLDDAVAAGFVDRDCAALLEIFEQWNGVSTRAGTAREGEG